MSRRTLCARLRRCPETSRQRVRRAIDALAGTPFPPESKNLDAPSVDITVCRIRLDRWRIIYAVSETDATIDVLGVRKRPPYDYGDLDSLLTDLS
jgi:mRNA interferase RelE/StbE